jgi:hypothetical protein
MTAARITVFDVTIVTSKTVIQTRRIMRNRSSSAA